MRKIRAKLTYANVVASLALFLALGGAAYAAAKLPKNSVGTKQIKNNAITAAKIKKNAVTGAKIKNGTITGNKIKLSSLGTVPSATSAGHAGSADNATNATNFSRYFNSGLKKASGGQNVNLTSVGPFTFVGHCVQTEPGTYYAEITATTSAPHSFFESEGVEYYGADFEPGTEAPTSSEQYFPESNEPEWYGLYGYYDEFSAASPDGSVLLTGYAQAGVNVFGANCAFSVSGNNAA